LLHRGIQLILFFFLNSIFKHLSFHQNLSLLLNVVSLEVRRSTDHYPHCGNFTKENATLRRLSEYPETLIQVTITMCKSVDLFETVEMARIYINGTINS